MWHHNSDNISKRSENPEGKKILVSNFQGIFFYFDCPRTVIFKLYFDGLWNKLSEGFLTKFDCPIMENFGTINPIFFQVVVAEL